MISRNLKKAFYIERRKDLPKDYIYKNIALDILCLQLKHKNIHANKNIQEVRLDL